MKLRSRIIICVVFLFALVSIAGIAQQSVDWSKLLKQAWPEADKFTQVNNLNTYKSRNLTQAAFPAYKGGNNIGVIFYATPQGYGGSIHTLTVIDSKGTVQKVHVFSHNETPAYVGTLPNYLAQFAGITLGDRMSFLVGTRASKRGEIQSMTGATETSQPIAVAVSEARKLFVEIYGKK